MNKPDGTDFLPDTLPPFDIEAALGRLNGKKTLLRKLLIKFHDIYINAIPTLNEMIEKGELEDAARLAHSIKGGAGNLEASDVFESSSMVELALMEGRIEDVPELILGLETAMKPAIEASATLKEGLLEGGT